MSYIRECLDLAHKIEREHRDLQIMRVLTVEPIRVSIYVKRGTRMCKMAKVFNLTLSE